MKRSGQLWFVLTLAVGLSSSVRSAAQPSANPPPSAASPNATAGTSQTPPAAGTASPPPATQEPVWLGAVPGQPMAAPSAPPEFACVPACRVGYRCSSGRCVSLCPRPCTGKKVCSANGLCLEPQKPIKPGAREHDGLLLRATTGFVAAGMIGEERGTREHATTVASNLALDIGAAVTRNLIVRGRLMTGTAFLKDSPFRGDVAVLWGSVGAGFDYYFMPANIYIGGTASLAGVATFDLNNLKDKSADHPSYASKAGVGLTVDAGKEWWVSSNFGLGLALRLNYINVGAAHVVPRSTGRLQLWQFGPLFTITYN